MHYPTIYYHLNCTLLQYLGHSLPSYPNCTLRETSCGTLTTPLMFLLTLQTYWLLGREQKPFLKGRTFIFFLVSLCFISLSSLGLFRFIIKLIVGSWPEVYVGLDPTPHNFNWSYLPPHHHHHPHHHPHRGFKGVLSLGILYYFSIFRWNSKNSIL